MKKTLDDLIAEYKSQADFTCVEAEDDSSSTKFLTEDMSWEERSTILMAILERNQGRISQKELMHKNINELGITNSEEGRQYLRNFLSWFVQQGIVRKKRISNRTYFFTNRNYKSSNITEYFSLINRRSRKDLSFKEIELRNFNRRLKILTALIEDKGSLPLDTVLNDNLGDLGFQKDSVGRQEAQKFIRKAVQCGMVQESRKDAHTCLEPPQKEKEQPAPVRTRRRVLTKEERETREQKKLEKAKPIVRTPVVRTPVQKAKLALKVETELNLVRCKSEYDEQIRILDDEFLQVAEHIFALKKKLTRINEQIVHIYSLRKSDPSVGQLSL